MAIQAGRWDRSRLWQCPTSIMGRTDSLLALVKATDPTYPQIQGIQKDAQRASILIRQLVEFAGGRAGEAALLDVGEIVFDLAHILIPMLGSKIELAVVREPELWTVSTNQSQLEMALMNLVKNARDAMPDGGQIAVVTRNKSVSAAEARPVERIPREAEPVCGARSF